MSVFKELDMGAEYDRDLSDDVIQRLDNLKQLRNQPRAELPWSAIELYLTVRVRLLIRAALTLVGRQERRRTGV